jgi:hypothetical protein
MGQRPKKGGTAEASKYRYQSVEACEEAEDFHVVTPKTWPPVRIGNQGGDPYLSAQCELCGGWLIVYRGHATGEMKGIKVNLPEKRKAS